MSMYTKIKFSGTDNEK